MTNTTINIAGFDNIADFYGKGNRLWFGDSVNPCMSVIFEGETEEDFFNAAREAITSMTNVIGDTIGFYALPILDELWECGGKEGDVLLCTYDTAAQHPYWL